MKNYEQLLLDSALSYAEKGFAVLPLHSVHLGKCSCGSSNCNSIGKHPRTVNGVKDASTNSAMIRSWWSKYPKANIGIALGEASGIWALDIDPRNGGDITLNDLEIENDLLPETLHAKTGGGGEHYFFKFNKSDGIRNGKLGTGVDVKSTGGYVVVAPSIHLSGQSYEWTDESMEAVDAPSWVVKILKGTNSSFAKILGVDVGDNSVLLSKTKVDEIRSALAVINSDDRETWLNIGMAIHSTMAGEQAFEIWDEWSKTSDKYNYEDASRVWSSFSFGAGGITIATLFGLAQSLGWKAPEASIELDAMKDKTPISKNPKGKVLKLAETSIPKMPDVLNRPLGIVADVADYITRTAVRPQPLFSLVGALSLVANVMGRKYETESGLRSNLYLVSIGATGCGKNHARSCIKKILSHADLKDNLGGEELASGQSILSRASETPNVLFQLDEFGLFMKSVQNPNAGSHLASILSILMKLFSSAGDIYVGTEYANNHKRPRVTIEYPCINVHATSTGETFYDALESKHVLSGYLNRLLVVETDVDRPPRNRKKVNREIPHPIIEWCHIASNPSGSGSGNLLGVNPATPLMVVKTQEASRMFDEYDDKIDIAIRETSGTGLDSLYNRAWEHADKVALVLAVAENPVEPVVEKRHAEFAIAFVDWSIECLVHQVNARVADSPFESRTKECLRAIANAGERGMTEREMGRHGAFAKLTPKERLEALTALSDAEQVERVQIKTAGRPRIAYVALAE
ncbi:MAG: putative bifunctional DNA primase/polymerase [Prokaryotic dsDNA virus sp.]|nr:MAG: putative bifunctional DNA primase/polymerase [Prokaryotic dsDNA virus sp.]